VKQHVEHLPLAVTNSETQLDEEGAKITIGMFADRTARELLKYHI
jgi:hypothetical protein